MNHLEESFSSISTIKELVDDVDRMIDCEDLEKEESATVLKGYLDIFTRKWTKHSEEIWNDVVIPCKIEDLHSYSETNYSEIADLLEEEKRLDETCENSLINSGNKWRSFSEWKGRCPTSLMNPEMVEPTQGVGTQDKGVNLGSITSDTK